MKTNFVLAIILVIALSLASAQISYPSCSSNKECPAPITCIEGKCRCEPGKKVDNTKGECVDVIGSKCTSEYDCLELSSATCNLESKTCVCNEDGCTTTGTAAMVISTSFMVFLTFGILRVW